jgi:hypothetical protein
MAKSACQGCFQRLRVPGQCFSYVPTVFIEVDIIQAQIAQHHKRPFNADEVARDAAILHLFVWE